MAFLRARTTLRPICSSFEPRPRSVEPLRSWKDGVREATIPLPSQLAAWARLSFRRLLRAFFRVAAAEDVRHRVIAFVARVLVNALVAFLHQNDRRPGSGPDGAIVHRDLIAQGFGIGPRDPFDHVQVLVGQHTRSEPPPDAGAQQRQVAGALLPEIRGIDDEGIALPPAA